jgi:uncharacterized protein (TIGR01777 family)
MKIVISGATGFVGSTLSEHLIAKGHRIIALGSRKDYPGKESDALVYVQADTTQKGDWQEHVADADAVINLAGRTIFRRWSKGYKKQIYDSRILTTRNLVAALPASQEVTFVSTSAVGYYGHCGDTLLDESHTPGEDFLARVCVDWEKESFGAAKRGARVVVYRFGVVLGHGGALSKMVPVFKLLAGGPLGNGRQWFAWVHMDDIVGAILFALEHDQLDGVFNLCAPQNLRQADFARQLGRVLNRPAITPAPAFMVRLAMGEMGGALLGSQRVTADLLMQKGFTFAFDKLEDALQDILAKT